MSESPGLSAGEIGMSPSYGSNHSDLESHHSHQSDIVTRVSRAPSFYPRSAGGMGEDFVEQRGMSSKEGTIYSTEQPLNAPVVLVWKDLTVRTRTATPKVLLNNISGQITGGFWAIMGASGSGKTTLLSAVSLRMDTTKMEAVGKVHLNGQEYDQGLLKAMSAYVMQDDLLHAELTVAETIKYAAELRLSGSMSPQQREQRQKDVISLLQIEHVKDVIIGDTQRKGISGGERKRVCVAIELLTAPKLIFLDEPTSGLDSTTALTVISTLKSLAEEGICTIVCTIHQPQKKIFELFDNLILMKQGSIVYQGACQKALVFARHFGKECPPEMNPADFLVDAISVNTKEVELGSAFDENAQKEVPVDLNLGLNKVKFREHEFGFKAWFAQFLTLTKRSWLQYARRTDIILMNFVLIVIISIFVSCGIWYQIGTGQSSIATRGPSLFFAAVTQGIVASLQTISRFPAERAIILRERAAGSYHVSAYFAARSVVDFVSTLWGTTLFCAIVYPTIGYQPGASKFFTYWIFMVLDTNAALSLATMISCLCVTIELSTVVLSLLLEITRLFGGFFTSPKQLLDYPNWQFADALSYLKYVFVGVAINEMSGLEYTCTAKEIAASKCVQKGEATMADKGYDMYTVDYCAGILVVYIVGCRIVAYLALRFIKR